MQKHQSIQNVRALNIGLIAGMNMIAGMIPLSPVMTASMEAAGKILKPNVTNQNTANVMKRINLQADCNCPKCTKPEKYLGCDPGAFESLEPEPRLMDDSPLWNDGGNVPPGVKEDEL